MRVAPPEQSFVQSKIFANAKKTVPVQLRLPKPHQEQYKLINAFELNPGVRFVAGACGTKFGKTFGCSIRLVKEAWENKNTLNWWVAPSYAQSKMAYALVKRLLPLGHYVEYKADLRITLLEPDGTEHSVIEFKSGDNPDSLRGFAVNFVVVDEAARMPWESFVSVMTTLTQTQGRAIVISTPKGRGWFWDVYQWGNKAGLRPGEKDDHPEWLAMSLPTSANPTVPREAIEQARINLPADVFRQEYLAEFLTDGAGVFRGIKDCEKGSFEQPLKGHNYVIGVDLARLEDYTVLTVMDRTRGTGHPHVVHIDRFNEMSWESQYNEIRDLSLEYNNALCVVDATGIGDPIVEALRGGGVPVEPYKIGGSTAKQQLIDKLRVNIEHGRISFPYYKHLRDELENYELQMTESGIVRYSAPPGKHDDCVISLALANWIAGQDPFIYRYSQRRGL